MISFSFFFFSSRRRHTRFDCDWSSVVCSSDLAILFAPVGALVPAALQCVRPGGRVVCAGIHMSDVPAFPYRLLWGERAVSSVANLTRADGQEFLALATRMGLTATVQRFALADANLALERLRGGALQGAAVLEMPGH